MQAALEAAWLVAKAGENATPPEPAPRPLRRLLGHARLTPAALSTIRKVVDSDEAFRARVADIVTEHAVGRAAWLFLTRPEGWEDEVAAIAAASEAEAAAAREGREERVATRRLKGAEEALRRTEQALEQARAHAAKAADELSRERHARRAAEQEAERLGAEVAEAQGEAAALRVRLAAVEGELVNMRAAAASNDDEPSPVEQVVVPVVPSQAVDAAARAASAVQAAEAALAEVVSALGVAETAAADAQADDDTDEAGDDEAVVGSAAPPRRRGPRPRRRAATLPPAVFDDTPEAADHLVRLPGALLLVDGYNASLAYRPELPLAELRRRLVDAVDELVARTGVEAHIVFDGAEVEGGGHPMRTGGRRRAARVRFSPPDVEADDVILGMVDETPPARPVVVASDDRRVQDGARHRGANVISTTQLLAALRRER
ncbi:MAG: NYN domain-containing protein [Actinobacteria bacterium]|nr:NYN domain-containing protein [Actinomycetota bacterium]